MLSSQDTNKQEIKKIISICSSKKFCQSRLSFCITLLIIFSIYELVSCASFVAVEIQVVII